MNTMLFYFVVHFGHTVLDWDIIREDLMVFQDKKWSDESEAAAAVYTYISSQFHPDDLFLVFDEQCIDTDVVAELYQSYLAKQ